MAGKTSEGVLYKTKLHWGIFLAPVIPGALMTLIGLWMMSQIKGAYQAASLDFGQRVPAPIHFPWILLLLPGLVIIGLPFFLAAISYLKTEIVLTKHHLRFNSGWLALSTSEIALVKVETMRVFEPLLGRMAGYGTVAVIGTGGTLFRLCYLPEPRRLHEILENAVRVAHHGVVETGERVTPQAHDDSRYMPKA